MEDNKKAGCGCGTNTCSCNSSMQSGHGMGMMCGWGHGHRRHGMLASFFVLMVMILVFCVGVQIGELKGEIRMIRGGYGMMKMHNVEFGSAPMMIRAGTMATPAPANQ